MSYNFNHSVNEVEVNTSQLNKQQQILTTLYHKQLQLHHPKKKTDRQIFSLLHKPI